jgi:Icc-related predicted phosphoesterase
VNRNRRLAVALVGVGVMAALTGCPERKPQLPAVVMAATEPMADAECAAPIAEGPPKAVLVGTRAATLTGTRLTFAGAGTGKLVLGVLGPINEDSGQNMLALKKYVAFFAAEKVDALVVTGDVGEQPGGIARVLKVLGATGLPVLVTIGNGECRADFTEGVEAAKAAFPNIINLTQVREVVFPELTLLSLPGYHDPAYIKCKSGCQYVKSTVNDVVRAAKRATTPVGLISHGPPRGAGALALDYANAGGNVGDQAITEALSEGKISFGFFSNIKEAGGRAVKEPAGTTLIKEGEASATLFLNPGPADSTQGWDMNDGSRSLGNAAVFTLQGGQGSWKGLRLKPLSAAEKAEAKALSPGATKE